MVFGRFYCLSPILADYNNSEKKGFISAQNKKRLLQQFRRCLQVGGFEDADGFSTFFR